MQLFVLECFWNDVIKSKVNISKAQFTAILFKKCNLVENISKL